MKKTILAFILLLCLVPSALAHHNTFDHRVDLNNINWFDRGLYFNSLPYQDCIDTHEFNQYADSDPYDRWDRDDLLRYTDRLDWQDLQRLADYNLNDNLDGDEFRKKKDFRCTAPESYKHFTNLNPNDHYDDNDAFYREYYSASPWYKPNNYHYRPRPIYNVRRYQGGVASTRSLLG